MKRPASTGGYQSAKREKSSGIKCFFKPKSSATPSLSTTESPSSGRASAVPDPLQVPDNPTVPDPPLPTPESPSSARASAVPDDSTAPDPEVTTPASVEEISESPYHPYPKLIPPKKTATQNIYFQRKWFGEYPWLSYNSTIGGVICHIMFNRVLFNYLNTYLIV